MICPNMCYKVNPNNAKYCEKCGYKFTDEDRYEYLPSSKFALKEEAEG